MIGTPAFTDVPERAVEQVGLAIKKVALQTDRVACLLPRANAG
jgi:hypothetical protein